MSYEFRITERGQELMSQCLDGADGLVLTRVVFGSGQMGEGQQADQMTELISPECDGSLIRRERKGSSLNLTAQLTNERYKGEGFTLNEYGIYGKAATADKEELILYATLGKYGQGVTPYTRGEAASVWSFPMTLTVSSELTVSIETPADMVTGEELSDVAEALRLELSAKGGGARIGTAEEISDLETGSVLFLTDSTGAEGYIVTLAELLAEGTLAAKGEANSLSTLATVSVANALNLRSSVSGARFASDEEVQAQITALCAAALAEGDYVADGVLTLSWAQVQWFLVYGELLTATAAEELTFDWCATYSSRLATLEGEVEALRALIGDLNKVLDHVNDEEVTA